MGRWLAGSLLALAFVLSMSGCARDAGSKISQTVPNIPISTDFGPLYPRINSLLQADPPDVITAMRDTRAWAVEHLDGFREGSCAATQVVYDTEFARIFGRMTLGVTLPWMQIYIRDGVREVDPFLWKDATLFVSTVLHEHVHAIQRARQAHTVLGAEAGCDAALGALNQRRGQWTSGFDVLRSSSVLSPNIPGPERQLLYRWVSPIERARDEVEASLVTVRWMHDHGDDLNELTSGGANNWAYGVQYLGQLRQLAKSNCFSPDDATYAGERHIYEVELPQFIAEYSRYESAMMYFLQSHNVPVLKAPVTEFEVLPTPTGRVGSRCNGAVAFAATRVPVPDVMDLHALEAFSFF